MQEIWKDVKDFEGYYKVSNLGRVKSLERKVKTGIKHNEFVIKKGKLLNNTLLNNGYYQVNLSKNGKTKKKQVHRLVAEAFLENPNNYKEINHKDENTQNNKVENLEWCDRKYNINWGKRTQKVITKLSKKINMYDLNNNFIRQFNGINEASRLTNISSNVICLCCKGKRKKAGNYIWKYSE